MLSPLRTLRLGRAMYRVFRDTERLDEVFGVADALATDELVTLMTEGLSADPQGAKAIAERPRLGVIDVAALSALPDGTLGRAYADFLTERGLSPEPLADKADTEGDFVLTHLYETHDLWHVVTGLGTDVAGELGLQAFYIAQTPGNLGSVLIAVGLLNAALFEQDDQRARIAAVARGWSIGESARPFFGVRWAEMWDRPLADIRAELNVAA